MYPYVADYLNLIGSRPTVKKAYEIGQQYRRVDTNQMKPEEWQTLFGNKIAEK